MADQEQIKLLEKGVDVWNKWRKENPNTKANLFRANLSYNDLRGADLSGVDLIEAELIRAELNRADLSGADLSGADFSRADLSGADLSRAKLWRADFVETKFRCANFFSADLSGSDFSRADLSGADLTQVNLSGANLLDANLGEAKLFQSKFIGTKLIGANLTLANLSEADLRGADLSGADLRGANLLGANLYNANLSRANLTGAHLDEAQLVRTNVSQANVSGCSVYGINVWDLEGEFEDQKQLIITPVNTAVVTVDNIKIAQFIYLILKNREIRDVLNSLTSKSVLILGRFALPERKEILDALRNKLREYDLVPIVFDFERPTDKDFTETIKTLAGLCLFVIADVTNPKSSPLELQATVPDYQVPFVPIIQEGEKPFAMMVDLQKKYNWVLKTRTYRSKEALIKNLKKGIVEPAMDKHNELRLIKAQEPETLSLDD